MSNKISVNTILYRIIGIMFFIMPIAYIFSRAFLLMAVYVAIVSWGLLRVTQNHGKLPKTTLNFPILFVVISLVLSIVCAGEWHEGFRGLNKWLRGFLVFWMCLDVLRREEIESKLEFSFVIAFVFAVFDGTYQYFQGSDLLRGFPLGYVNGNISRITSSFGYFGMYASFLIMVIPIVLIWGLQNKTKSKQIFCLAILLVGILNLYWTRSRGAWVSFGGMIVLFSILSKKWKLTALISLGLCGSLFLIPRQLLFHHERSTGMDKTINHRFELWQQAINVIKAKPVTGTGLNTYVKKAEQYNPGSTGEVKDYYAHNGYLQHTAETGFVGLFAFLWFLGSYLTLIWRRWKAGELTFEISFLIVSVFGFLFYVFFDTIFHNLQPFLLFWMLMGWSVGKLEKEKVSSI